MSMDPDHHHKGRLSLVLPLMFPSDYMYICLSPHGRWTTLTHVNVFCHQYQPILRINFMFKSRMSKSAVIADINFT